MISWVCNAQNPSTHPLNFETRLVKLCYLLLVIKRTQVALVRLMTGKPICYNRHVVQSRCRCLLRLHHWIQVLPETILPDYHMKRILTFNGSHVHSMSFYDYTHVVSRRFGQNSCTQGKSLQCLFMKIRSSFLPLKLHGPTMTPRQRSLHGYYLSLLCHRELW